ncbi:MAG: cytidylate kinase-like family protein [Desulfobacterales bacterium]
MAVLTISRQFGAGGITLGKRVAKKLGYTFYDDEIIRMVAKKANVSAQWVESMEKEAGGKIERLISGLVSKSFFDRLLDDRHGYIDEEIYVDLLHKIITKIAAEGNAVILGRGSQFILKEAPDAFHILLVADREYRIKFIEEKYELFTKHAVQTINSEDKRRTSLYRKFGKEDYDNWVHYHLILNMSRVGLDAAEKLVCKLVRPS